MIRAIVFNDEAPDIIEVHYTDVVAHLPMTLWLWATGKPWVEPVALEVIDGECQLPDHLRGSGPFVTQITLGVKIGIHSGRQPDRRFAP